MNEKMININNKIRRVDNQEYLGMLCEIIREGHEVSLLIAGSSMSPFLCHERDSVILAPVRSKLKRGDIVLFRRQNGLYILHRICKVNRDHTYHMIGDNQTEIEKNIREEQILAIVNKVKRNGKTISPGDFWWEFFAKIWISLIPFRRMIIRLYSLIKFQR